MKSPIHMTALSVLEITASLSSPDPCRDALIDKADFWFSWLMGATAAVAVGCVLEIGEASTEFLHWWWHKKDKPFKEEETRPTILVSMIGLILVIIGVTAEGFFEAKQSSAETNIRAYDEQKTLAAQSDATEAKRRVAEVEGKNLVLSKDLEIEKGKTADAQVDASNAQRAAELEKENRLKFEAKFGWRTISPKQQNILDGELFLLNRPNSYFDGATIMFQYWSGDAEAEAYAEDIGESINKALYLTHLNIEAPTDVEGAGFRVQRLITLQYPQHSEAGIAIFKSLNDAGVAVTPQPFPGRGENILTMFVGTRPKPK